MLSRHPHLDLEAVGILTEDRSQPARGITILAENLRAFRAEILRNRIDIVGDEPVMVHTDRTVGLHQLKGCLIVDFKKTEAVARSAFSHRSRLPAEELLV